MQMFFEKLFSALRSPDIRQIFMPSNKHMDRAKERKSVKLTSGLFNPEL